MNLELSRAAGAEIPRVPAAPGSTSYLGGCWRDSQWQISLLFPLLSLSIDELVPFPLGSSKQGWRREEGRRSGMRKGWGGALRMLEHACSAPALFPTQPHLLERTTREALKPSMKTFFVSKRVLPTEKKKTLASRKMPLSFWKRKGCTSWLDTSWHYLSLEVMSRVSRHLW